MSVERHVQSIMYIFVWHIWNIGPNAYSSRYTKSLQRPTAAARNHTAAYEFRHYLCAHNAGSFMLNFSRLHAFRRLLLIEFEYSSLMSAYKNQENGPKHNAMDANEKVLLFLSHD